MRQFYNRLLQGGCVLALTVGVMGSAHAQSGSLGVGATKITGGGGFGMDAKAWIPFGGFGAYLDGGFQDHNPFADVGVGARFMLGNSFGMGSLLTFGMQKGESNKMFYAVKPTLEIGLGGFTLSSTLQIPVGKKERSVKNSGAAEGEFRDQPGSTECSNPTNTTTKICNLWLVGQEKSTEQNRFGVNLNAQYELNLGSFSITPNAGIYVYDRQGKNLVGVHGGVKFGLGFGNGLAIEAGVNVRHDNKSNQYADNRRTQAVFTAGLTWHFGGDLAGASESFVNRAPVRTVFDRGLRTQEKRGNSFAERAGLKASNTNAPLDAVEFVDSGVMNPYNKIGSLGPNRMIIVQGGIDIAFGNNTATIAQDNVFVVGGGSTLELVTLNGHTGTFTAPGIRPNITAGNVTAVFKTDNNRNNVLFKGFDINGNGVNTTRAFHIINNSNYIKIDDVSVANVTRHAVQIENKSDNNSINNLRVSNVGEINRGVIEVNDSQSALITNITLDKLRTGSIGIWLTNNADHTIVRGFDINDDDNNYQSGIKMDNNVDDVEISYGSIRNFAANGIVIDGDSSDDNELRNLTIQTSAATNGHGILISNGADAVTLTNISVTGSGVATFRALQVNNNSTNIRIGNFHAENWEVGFGLTGAATTVVDLDGNSFTAVGGQTACDAVDVMGGINVTVTNTGMVPLCR